MPIVLERFANYSDFKFSLVRENQAAGDVVCKFRKYGWEVGLVENMFGLNFMEKYVEAIKSYFLWANKSAFSSSDCPVFNPCQPQGARADALPIGCFEIDRNRFHPATPNSTGVHYNLTFAVQLGVLAPDQA